MAIPVLSPTSSNFVNINDPSSSPNLPLSYGLNSTSKWIYCNYPEKLRSDSFGDTNLGNKCLNQVTVPTGTHQIFYSYNTVNMTDTIKFGIQIFNPNPTSITFRKLYGGHADSAESGGWTGSILNSWSRYFASSPENSITISSNGSYWCLEESVPKSRIFSGSIRFSVSDAAIITVYAYKNKNMINGTAIPYLYNGDYGHQYSGYGNGYFFSANLTLKASELASGGKWFKTNCPTGLPNISINGTSQTSDLISIHLANPSSTTITPYGGYFCYVAVPCQYVCYEKSYPWYLDNHSEYTDKSSSALFAKLEEKGIDYVDMRKSAKNLTSCFSSTIDNHYGIEGAYLTYAQIIDHINKNSSTPTNLLAKSDFEKVEISNRYLGSRVRKLLGVWESDEKLGVMYPKESIPFTRTDNGQATESVVYSIPNAEDDVLYSLYMGGDLASTVIDTGRPDKPTVLIYGDSFTNAVECIAWTSFNQMYSFDFRHYKEKTLSQLIDELRPDIVICIRDYEALLSTDSNGQ